ncbi:MAG: WYL domain-containing protein [Kofleriaceae bacterium]|nr:WYL domain-containing protein [Kofleriaceae bacterium]
MDLLELLRASDVLSVTSIAESLAVSRRTVLRDLASLRDRGWPIASEAGPGGGVYLDRDRGIRAVHLSLDEVASLWLAAQLSKSVGQLPWSRAARSALNKVFASVPQDRQRRLRQLVKRVVVGRPASAQVLAGLESPPPELLTAFEQAFAGDLCLAFDYTDRHGKSTKRRAEPHGLLIEAPAWYLMSRDTESQQPRMFRMDRMRRVRVLPDKPFKPDFATLRLQHEQLRTQK